MVKFGNQGFKKYQETLGNPMVVANQTHECPKHAKDQVPKDFLSNEVVCLTRAKTRDLTEWRSFV